MKKIFLLIILSLTLTSCNQRHETNNLANNVNEAVKNSDRVTQYSAQYNTTSSSEHMTSSTQEIYLTEASTDQSEKYNDSTYFESQPNETISLFDTTIYAAENETKETKATKETKKETTTVETTKAETTKATTKPTETSVATTAQKPKTKSAKFTTWFNTKNYARATNIKLAAKKLDGKIVQPGEIFSFNKIVGKSSSNAGYKIAKIVINGKESLGIGGGICQVSSTLFNATEIAGMEIVERHIHSKKVEYVDENRDATVAYGGKDFKFKNVTDSPQKITAVVKKGELTVSLTPVA